MSAVELKELALERNVSPPNEFAVGEDGTWRLSREWSAVDLDAEQSDSKDAVDAESCRSSCHIFSQARTQFGVVHSKLTTGTDSSSGGANKLLVCISISEETKDV